MAAARLHPGFHKTGTGAAQHFLAENRARLAPHLQIVLLDALKPADKTARPLLLFCEGLAGGIPGRAGVADYAALIDLVPIIIEVMEKYGLPDLTLHFTLRDPQNWLCSACLHNITGTKLDMDFANYERTVGASSDLLAIVDQARAVCRGTKVTTSHLEDAQNIRFGPATPLLAPIDLPNDVLARLTPPRRVNPSLPGHLIEPVRELNRGPLRGKALKAAKARLIAGAPDPDGAA